MKLSYKDKFLPTQPEHCKFFEGDSDALSASMYNLVAKYSALEVPTDEFVISPSKEFTIEEMGSNPVLLRLLEFLVGLKQPRRVLEIGTFIGISALYMARALPPDGILVTIEKYDRFAEIAEQNFAQNVAGKKIHLLRGDAFDVLGKFKVEQPFDMIFIDGDKERYGDYFSLVDPMLAPDALVIVDDVFFHGDALNPTPSTAKGKGTQLFLEKARLTGGYLKSLLPVGNGVMLLLKRP
jgi:caffeoyl-CoA O-methyltransferase